MRCRELDTPATYAYQQIWGIVSKRDWNDNTLKLSFGEKNQNEFKKVGIHHHNNDNIPPVQINLTIVMVYR